MLRLKAIGAYVLTYGFYALMWAAMVWYLFAAYNQLSNLFEPESERGGAGFWYGSWGVFFAVLGLAIFALAVRGFVEWSRPRRERLWELWLEGEDPSWIEVHRQKRLEGE